MFDYNINLNKIFGLCQWLLVAGLGIQAAPTNNGSHSAGNCLGNSKDRFVQLFSEDLVNAICARHDNWLHQAYGSTGSDEINGKGMDDVERDLYKALGRPHTPITQPPDQPKHRKEYRMLTDEERQRFHNAIIQLKALKAGQSNYYDLLVNFHTIDVSPGAHWGPAFLGWHRQYLLRLERALQAVDDNITVPYWDSALDSNLGDQASDSIMWSEHFMGNTGGFVVNGAFANWSTTLATGGKPEFRLWRGNHNYGRLYTDADVDYVVSQNDFRSITWHVDPYFEFVHGAVHFWIGGHMADIQAAPNDPVFFTHHCFIDHVWEIQRQRVLRDIGPENYVYPAADDDEAYGVGQVQDPIAATPVIATQPSDSFHYPTKKMNPFRSLKNRDGLSEAYQAYYYYAPRPTCSATSTDCGSTNLFCIDGVYKCAPKLRPGADCSAFANSDSCYKGSCVAGVCLSS